jgi:aminoglycoside phosphotransferase (APT) family kinase protein
VNALPAQDERADIGEADIIAFLAEHQIHATEVAPYADGIASRNFRATGPGNLDLTLRCDLRRSLDNVREDRRYAQLAHAEGISVPEGAWIDGHIRNVATTARPTIAGANLSQVAASQLPAPQRIGEILSVLHTVAAPLGNRSFFYAGLLDASDPLWQHFPLARAAFHQEADIHSLIEQAMARLEHAAAPRRAMAAMPCCLIHGDFNPPNILTDGTKLVLIDWEKACAGYPVADLVQAVYYFSACYGRHGLPFARPFMQAYARVRYIPRPILAAWLFCFPAFIFLRDTVSASVQPSTLLGCRQLTRFRAYVHEHSAPRFRHFLDNEPAIHDALLS